MTKELTLRVVLESPPPGVDFGIQKGRGSIYETIQKQRSTAKDMTFEFTVGLKDSVSGAEPDFAGPLVHGPPGERFIYIDIGACAGQTDTCWTRRLKIPLRGITLSMTGRPLEARVPGTAKDGGPNCASVKPFDGWK